MDKVVEGAAAQRRDQAKFQKYLRDYSRLPRAGDEPYLSTNTHLEDLEALLASHRSSQTRRSMRLASYPFRPFESPFLAFPEIYDTIVELIQEGHESFIHKRIERPMDKFQKEMESGAILERTGKMDVRYIEGKKQEERYQKSQKNARGGQS